MTKSLRPDNQLVLACPVVGRQERFLACILRRHKKWRGEEGVDPDCATAMNANKCPAVHMIRKEGKEDRMIYFATDSQPRKIPKDIADRIEKVVIVPMHGWGTGIDAARLSDLVGAEVEVPIGLDVPADPRKAKGVVLRSPKSRKEQARGAVSNDVLDNVNGDIAHHLHEEEISG